MKIIQKIAFLSLVCTVAAFTVPAAQAQIVADAQAIAVDGKADEVAIDLLRQAGDVNIDKLPAHCRDGLTRGEYGCCYITCPNLPRIPKHTEEEAQRCAAYAARQCNILSQIGCGAVWYFGPGYRDSRFISNGTITTYCRRNVGVIRLSPIGFSN